MTPAEEAGLLIAELRPLLTQLEALLPEPVADPTSGTMSRHRVTGSPAPWHPEAGPVLLTIHEEVRRLEASLRQEVAGHLGPRRGGSDANTDAALSAIANLVFAVPEEHAAGVVRVLKRWIRQAQQIRDIGEAERWEPIKVPGGQLPPSCPFCSTYSLRVARRSGLVACSNARCEDSNGERPRGRIDKNRLDGSAMLVWADGRTIYYGSEA